MHFRLSPKFTLNQSPVFALLCFPEGNIWLFKRSLVANFAPLFVDIDQVAYSGLAETCFYKQW